ncbi:MAG TPA: hypothetical protein VH247_13020 [Thermoleophilaceae bacterium]|nr:hypothetical protein [Thermoleophilaceae bacterium]
MAALIFNGIQVADTATQQHATREATEVQLLTQLNGVVNDGTLQIANLLDRTNAHSARLSFREQAMFDHALNDFDYVAWLFEHRFLTLPAAKAYWRHTLACAYHSAVLLEPRPEVNRNFPSLARYRHGCD